MEITSFPSSILHPLSSLLLFPLLLHAQTTQPYTFDSTISQPTLNAYLSRAVTSMDLLTGAGDFPDNLRMLHSIGAKYAGRSILLWGSESSLPQKLTTARTRAAQLHTSDPDLILEAGLFECISKDINQIPIPPWAFTAFNLPVESRTFRFDDIRYPDNQLLNQWGRDTAVPDISRPEAKLWFYYLARSYIDIGIEALHFGQVELMNRNDPHLDHWSDLFTHIRAYAHTSARRHLVLINAHTPSHGLLRDHHLLLDFHAMPLRIIEDPSHPQHAFLQVGYTDTLYTRSKGGITPSGWSCPHLPYLVELDNWGASDHPGEPHQGGIWTFGYDEITWFAHQPTSYRNDFLRYADHFLHTHDPVGHLEMPASRCLSTPVNNTITWYSANTPSPSTPNGFDQETTIKSIWSNPN